MEGQHAGLHGRRMCNRNHGPASECCHLACICPAAASHGPRAAECLAAGQGLPLKTGSLARACRPASNAQQPSPSQRSPHLSAGKSSSPVIACSSRSSSTSFLSPAPGNSASAVSSNSAPQPPHSQGLGWPAASRPMSQAMWRGSSCRRKVKVPVPQSIEPTLEAREVPFEVPPWWTG